MRDHMRHIVAVFMLVILASCMKDDELWKRRPLPHDPASPGLFIINEGNFAYENASLDYYDIVSRKSYHDVFFNTNGLSLGDVAQSMEIHDSLGYVVLNGSGKIYIINTATFELAGKITGFTSPRYIHFISAAKAYVTDLYSRSVAIVDPELRSITGSISVNNNAADFNQHPTEQMIRYGRYVFTNCWSFDDKILVIDTETDQLLDSIQVLIQPQSMVLDAYGKLWVLTDGGYEGNPYGHERPGLIRIDAETRTVEKEYRFSPDDLPSELKITGGGDTLYFLNRHVYRHAVLQDKDPEIFIESPHSGQLGGYYGLGIDPVRSDIYVADALDHVQRGIVYRFNGHGVPLDTLKAGINPGSFCFKP